MTVPILVMSHRKVSQKVASMGEIQCPGGNSYAVLTRQPCDHLPRFGTQASGFASHPFEWFAFFGLSFSQFVSGLEWVQPFKVRASPVPVEFDRGLDSFGKARTDFFVSYQEDMILLLRVSTEEDCMSQKTTERLLNKDMKLDTSRIQQCTATRGVAI